ncbi:reticulon-like protein B1 [Dioscorea cayenensis subsp. rotundata]|uniref:Reticulon-like protein n=1 Tax=Dioscorea cayennensis subsp. rotundata TaxID=55577 RepID=A0AB40BMA7_DIOCR|nr:reticulon-like protein B1 [Dioscorea cayenensis subsp. rotundata]
MVEAVERGSFMEKINEKIHEYKESSSSDSEGEQPSFRKKRLFGRKEPVHAVLGGGKSADIVLWRNKQLSASILAGVTVLWLLFECMGYHLLTFVSHSLILALAVSFIWSNAAAFLNRAPPKFPEVMLSEELFLSIAHTIRYEINEAFATFQYVASGKDLKKFLMVIAGLWIVSVVGNWFSFLTLSYIVFVLLYTLPALYENYEDQVDTAAEKAMVEINKKYAILDAKFLQKIPRGPFADKKQQ